MVNEVAIICMDTSSWMEHYTSDRFLGQIDAIGVYCEKYLQTHPENYVGVLAMGGENPPGLPLSFHSYRISDVVEPTKDLSLIMSRVRDFVNVGGSTLLVTPLTWGSYHLNEKYENHLKRMVVFAGGPIEDSHKEYTKLGTKLKERGVALDVVNFGAQQLGYKKHQLLVILAAANNNDNTRMLDLCGHHLNGSSITPLVVGQGEHCLYADCLLQGEDLRKAKNQCDNVHGEDASYTGYFFRALKRVEDERRKRYSFHDLKPDGGNDDTRNRKGKRDDRGHDEGRERYRDRGNRYGRERYYRVGDSRKLKIRDWDIGKYIPLDDDAGEERYWDRGDGYGRKREYRVRDEGREIYRVGGRRKLKRDDDAGKERYLDRGDSFHDLKPDGGNDDTRNRKGKRDDRGHDEGRERYRDRGDRYGRERYYRAHDDERGRD
ncbi:26S proteasome non-ATPase regulatory subunit 4 [Tanacetum coccineum]